MSSSKASWILTSFILCAACAAPPKPTALASLDRALSEGREVERIRAVAPDMYAEAERYRAAATQAYQQGDHEKTDFYAEIGALTLATAKERVRVADAEASIASSEARTAAAVNAKAEYERSLSDASRRVDRMDRIAELEQNEAAEHRARERLASEVARSTSRAEAMKPLAEVRALFEEAQALPEMSARQDQRGVVVTLPELFATGKAEILPQRKGLLRALADLARKYPGYPLSVDGYTDSTGPDSFNQVLSSARAAIVARYLTDEEKLDTTRVISAGHGSSEPVALNSRG